MTVNGSSAQVRIKAADGDNWDGTTPRLRYVSVTCASTTGNTTQGVRFQVVSDGRLPLSSGVIDNSSYTVLSSPLLTIACSAPTTCSVSPILAEGGVTLSWSGASGGINNAITSYEIQYSESSDNLTWGAWTALTTVTTSATSGSVATSPPSTRGNYRRFQVRTRGAAGASYYSGWKISTNSVRRNTAPSPAATAAASPSVYSDEVITLTWSGASGGTSPVKGYQIARRTSTDNSTWSIWNVLTTLLLSANSGSYNPDVSRTPGTYTQFGIWTIDTFDVYSVEKITGSIYCDVTACGAPTVCSVSAALAEGNVTLSWSGATGGAGNAITSYEIQYSDAPDNSSWGDWTALTTVSTSATNGSLSVSPPATRGNYRRFRIRTRGAAGASYYSDWTVSGNSVRRNTLPTPPSSFTATPAIYEVNTITLDDCMAGKIDKVITKSISRFARNTVDCLNYIRKLKEKNIPVYFEKENIDSMDSKGEIMLTIMASLAQQESQSLSQNVKLGLQYRYQQGEIQVNCKWFLGYTKDEKKKLIIVPEEAEVVKRIYREYLEGASMLKIARGLEADGILNGAGREKWHTSNINQILRNEKYIGDALLQKTYTTDFLTKTRVKNHGHVPQYYVENSHEAIIPREIFMQVQEELIWRRIVHTSPNGKNRTFSSTHSFSNMIVCGGCGEFFRRIHWNNRGKKSVVWRCISRLENTGQFCDARTVLESTIELVLITAINQTLCDKDTFLVTLQKNIETVISHGNDTALADIDKRLGELQVELVKLANSKAEYDKVGDEIYRLRDEKQKVQLDNIGRDELKKRIDDMGAFLREQPTAITEYDEPLVRRLIEKVAVYEDKFTVEFKSGVTVDVDE